MPARKPKTTSPARRAKALSAPERTLKESVAKKPATFLDVQFAMMQAGFALTPLGMMMAAMKNKPTRRPRRKRGSA